MRKIRVCERISRNPEEPFQAWDAVYYFAKLVKLLLSPGLSNRIPCNHTKDLWARACTFIDAQIAPQIHQINEHVQPQTKVSANHDDFFKICVSFSFRHIVVTKFSIPYECSFDSHSRFSGNRIVNVIIIQSQSPRKLALCRPISFEKIETFQIFQNRSTWAHLLKLLQINGNTHWEKCFQQFLTKTNSLLKGKYQTWKFDEFHTEFSIEKRVRWRLWFHRVYRTCTNHVTKVVELVYPSKLCLRSIIEINLSRPVWVTFKLVTNLRSAGSHLTSLGDCSRQSRVNGDFVVHTIPWHDVYGVYWCYYISAFSIRRNHKSKRCLQTVNILGLIIV